MPKRQLTAADGHSFEAYETIPAGEIKGGVVIIQEIFGVNQLNEDAPKNLSEEAQAYLNKFLCLIED